jgi:hypothetical protein
VLSVSFFRPEDDQPLADVENILASSPDGELYFF